MKYWVYLNGEVPGSYIPEELAAIPGVGETTMVCPAEGGIEERNWLRAGQFPELVDAIRHVENPPMAPQAPVPTPNVEPGRPLDPNDILSDSSSRIFSHVSDLMKELENRRDERGMHQSLQRQVVELKNELLALRERNAYLTERSDLIPGFQDREAKISKDIESIRIRIQERDAAIRHAESNMAKALDEMEQAQRRETAVTGELKRQSETMEELAKTLAQKEFTLAKAFGVIRRLEEVLGEILPSSIAGISREVPGLHEVQAEKEEPPPPPPPQEAPPEPVAQPEIQVRKIDPAPAEPVIKDTTSTLYTEDTGKVEKPVELPPEGEVTPIPAPWTKIVDKIKGFLAPEEKAAQEEAPPAPKPENDKTPDQN